MIMSNQNMGIKQSYVMWILIVLLSMFDQMIFIKTLLKMLKKCSMLQIIYCKDH